ncbi:MAG: hypothetical protein JNN02_11820 [Tabrizicola sp.]|nr:hypothetical protein [Tabrizicola sp.]
MAEAEAELTVAERLGRLLDRGLLPAGGPAEAAERLIERLQRPARVALLGLPGSGKSAILNLLAGTIVVPETLRLPTIVVQYGAERRMLCTLSDGHTEVVPGTDLEKCLTLSPALITLELDLPALKVISLLEVTAGPLEIEQRRAALWAGKRADILLWCTTSYLPKEQLVWEGMPDAFKDNGFLLLTKVDLLGGKEAASGMHHRVSQRASGEFRQVLSISAKEARAATAEDGTVDRDRFRESGASAVITTIKSRVQMAIRADTDTAELILARHGEEAEPPSRPAVEPAAVVPATPPVPTEASLEAEQAALERIVAATAAISEEPVAGLTQDAEPEALPEAESAVEAGTPADAELGSEALPAEPQEAEISGAPAVEAEDEQQPKIEEPEAPQASLIEQEADTDLEPGTEPVDVSDAVPDVEISLPPATDAAKTAEVESGPPESEPEEAAETDAHAFSDETEDVPDFVAAPDLASDADGEEEEATEEKPSLESDERSTRFTARLKQIPQESDTSKSGLIPLRATWKSRTDAADSMPIEPKPAPNTNLTPRARPGDPAREARLVGKLPRPAERSGSRAADPASTPVSDSRKISTEPEKRQTKITSVFGNRPRPAAQSEAFDSSTPDDLFPEGLTPVGVHETREAESPLLPEPASVEHQEAEPQEAGTEAIFKEPDSEAQDPTPVEEQPSEVAEADEPDPPVAPASGPEDSRPSLSERLGIPSDAPVRRDIPGAVRVSRPAGSAPTERFAARPAPLRPVTAAPMPSPQDIVAPRVSVLHDRRVEGVAADRRERPRIAPISRPVEPAPAAALAELPAAEKLYLEQAISVITARSAELAGQIDPDEKPPVDLILQHGLETTEQVMSILSRGGTAQLRRITASVGEIQDLILLMQLEKGHAPADDTLTLLLQLKREMETLRAA